MAKKKNKMIVIEKTKDATILQSSKGKKFALLTPSGRFKKYGEELKMKANSTTGEVLSDCAAGYRMGYRAALGEQAKIYKRYNKNK